MKDTQKVAWVAVIVGGIGGVLPTVQSMTIVDQQFFQQAALGRVISYSLVRCLGVFFLGSLLVFVKKETDLFKALLMGIAAPALFTGYINAHKIPPKEVTPAPSHGAIAWVTSAYAADDPVTAPTKKPVVKSDPAVKPPPPKKESLFETFIKGVKGEVD